MSERLWSEVDDFFGAHVLGPDPVLAQVLERNAAAGLPSIDVSPAQGRFLTLLVRILGARRVLEVGTLGGYSSICMARGLSDGGRVVSLEYSPKHAEVARANLAAAGVADRVEVRVGRAADLLAHVEGPIDLAFIDADKASTPAYLEAAIGLSRPGSVIVLDNVVRGAAILDAASEDPHVRGMREALQRLGADGRVEATALQIVGLKGYDGFAIARVR